MAAIHETAYPRLKATFTTKEMNEVFLLQPAEIDFIDEKTKTTNIISKLGFALLLKHYQYLGRPIKLSQVNSIVKKHIAKQLNVAIDCNLTSYARATRHRHINLIRRYLGINVDRQARRKMMKATALAAAKTKENLADIINRVIEDLLHDCYELPAYPSLLRLARAARSVTHSADYQRINDTLCIEKKKIIDKILKPDDNSDTTSEAKQWTWLGLKQEPKKPTQKNIRHFIQYVQSLKELYDELYVDLSFMMPKRLEHLRDEAMVSDQSDMKKYSDLKRYSLVVIFVYMKLASSMDDLTQVLIGWIRRIEAIAKERFKNYRLEQAEKTDQFVLYLYTISR